MATQLERLSFQVSLLDQVTGPAGRIQKALGNTAKSARSAFADIGSGALGIAGAGLAMKSILDPAIEMDRALGEVRSLGVAQTALDELSNTALKFSVQYSKSAAEFVSASYDIQSAIAGLSGAELSKFTESAGVLAAATKSNTATITNYMGTMYGVFKNTADAMGKSNWVQVLAGQTASAVQMFKTTGDQMSAAFTSIGANATSAGIAMNEQMAILGTLQATMSGSEAGTKYKSFLAGVGNAQKSLGLQFTDSQGQMLGMVDILSQLRGKFGDSLDVAESDALKKAFGSDEAVSLVKQLMADTDGLAASINKLGKVNGMKTAEKMAKDMVDPWQRMSAGITAVTVALGQSLLPVINPIVDSMADAAATMTRWSEQFPTVTKYVGTAVMGILAMTATLGALAVVSGLAKVAMIGWGMAAATVSGIMTALNGVMAAFRWVMIAVNLVMFTNPIGLMIAGIAALIAVVGTCIYWWEDLKAAFLDTAWGQALMSLIGDLMDWFQNLQGIAGTTVNWVVDKLNMIPGVDIGTEGASPETGTINRDMKTAAVSPGGVTSHISKTLNSNRSSNNNVVINTTQAPTAGMMNNYFGMEAL